MRVPLPALVLLRFPRSIGRSRPRVLCATPFLVLFLVCTLACAQTVSAAESSAPNPAGPVSVLVSVVPLATFVERIGGDQVRVQPLVRPGQNPHAYEPSPRQVADFQSAELFVRVGLPIEDAWLPRIRAVNPGLVVLDVREGMALRPNDPVRELGDGSARDRGKDHDRDGHGADDAGAGAHSGGGRAGGRELDHDDDHDNDNDGGQGHGHDHGAWDPHLWTSPPLVKAMGAAIRDALTARRPAEAARFAASYDAFAAELDALDRELRARLAPVTQRRFLVFHPAWGYFADTYGLTQVAIEYEGKEPGPRALAGLIDAARAAGVRTVLVQPQFSPRAARQVAAAIDGRVEAVDPLSPDYFATLRRLADLIAGDAPR